MTEHLSDDEELERLKQWWRESGRQTLMLVVLLVGGYFGWQGWQERQQQQAYTASAIYQQMVEAASVEAELSDEEQAAVTHFAITLIDKHGSSQYGHYARLLLARLSFEDNDLETAATYLTDAMEKANEGISLIARLRLARVEAERGNLDVALDLLNNVEPKTLTSAYAEAEGDIKLLQGDKDAAYEAYDKALATLSPEQNRLRPLLEMKRNQTRITEANTDTKAEAVEGDS